MNGNMTQLWVLLLCVAAGIAIVAIASGVFFAWRKMSTGEGDPIPHCNLQERLAQIAQAPMVQGRKLDLPAATSGSD
jgi:hypothetical protein